MSQTKSPVFVLYYDLNRCIGTVEGERRDEPIVEYALTTKKDTALFRRGMDDAAGWMRICSFGSREEAVQHVKECLSRAAKGDQQRIRPWAGQGMTTAVVRTVTCRRGTRTAGQNQVHVVYGEDETVKDEVEEVGVGAIIHTYEYSTEQDVAEFERALENHAGWWENDCFGTRADAIECLNEQLS